MKSAFCSDSLLFGGLVLACASSPTIGQNCPPAYRIIDLGDIDDFDLDAELESIAMSINDSNVVVGAAQDHIPRWQAFIWSPSGGVYGRCRPIGQRISILNPEQPRPATPHGRSHRVPRSKPSCQPVRARWRRVSRVESRKSRVESRDANAWRGLS